MKVNKSKVCERNTMLHFGLLFVVWLLFFLIVVPIGLIIGKKLYYNVQQNERHEKGKVLQRIIKTYVVVQCVAWPLILGLMGVVIVAKMTKVSDENPTLNSLLRVIISTYRFLYLLTLSYVGFNSLIIAICRYIFIVIVKYNDTFTTKRIGTYVLTSSIIVPVLLTFLHEATVPARGTLDGRWMEELGKIMTQDNDKFENVNTQVIRNTTTTVQQSVVFNLFEEYVPFVIKFGIDMACIVMKLAIFSNVIEMFLYVHIYILSRRNDNKVLLDTLLSEESRIKRNRKKTINIQMTFISWSLEFVAGLFVILQLMAGWLRLVTQLQTAKIFLSLILLSVFLNFVIIPGTYLLHTDICKAFVISQGWWKSFRTLFSLNRAAPIQNEGLEEHRNPNVRPIPNVVASKNVDGELDRNPSNEPDPELRLLPIPTISGNINVNKSTGLRVLVNNYM